jgi:methanogenic corrinoid protein MtbC1
MLETRAFQESLLLINRIEAERILVQSYKELGSVKDTENIIVNSLKAIGDGWETGEYSLAQVYMAGVICEELFDKIFIVDQVKRKASPKLGICVFKDYHALGKRIVKSVILSSGIDIIDIGEGLDVADIVKSCIEHNFDIILVSTLMLPSALKVAQIREEFTAQGIRTKIIAGGAPFRFDPTLWEKVGADADGGEATDIVSVIERVVGKRE